MPFRLVLRDKNVPHLSHLLEGPLCICELNWRALTVYKQYHLCDLSQIKWQSGFMHLVLSWNIGFDAMCIVAWLAQFIRMGTLPGYQVLPCIASTKVTHVVFAMARYSALALELLSEQKSSSFVRMDQMQIETTISAKLIKFWIENFNKQIFLFGSCSKHNLLAFSAELNWTEIRTLV